MKVLDLFCGLKGWTKAFEERGHEIISVDIEKEFNPTICKDIMDLEAKDFEQFGKFDLVLASPPCNCFSVASVYRHWKNKKPIDDATIKSLELVKHTLELIEDLKPRWWIVENPRGMLRKQTFMNPYDRREITQCQYGRKVMKPTDLWGKFPKSFIAKKCRPGNLCHERASRSSTKGLQGINSELTLITSPSLRALIPYGLSLAVCLACEKEIL